MQHTALREKDLQLLAVTCLYIAAKYEEVYVARADEFARSTDNAYSCEQILAMECEVLQVVQWDVNLATPCDFMHMMMREWDSFAETRFPWFPRFKGRCSRGVVPKHFADCMHLLDLARLFEEH